MICKFNATTYNQPYGKDYYGVVVGIEESTQRLILKVFDEDITHTTKRDLFYFFTTELEFITEGDPYGL